VVCAGTDGSGGKCIEIINSQIGKSFKTIYYHLNNFNVKVGDNVRQGQLIGHTTIDGRTQNRGNGYNGAIDPKPYFPKNYSKSRAYHRYGRKRNWLAEYCMRFGPVHIKNRWSKAGQYIQRVSKRLKFLIPVSGERTNALIYGGWSLDDVINPAMTHTWMWYKKDEYEKILKK